MVPGRELCQQLGEGPLLFLAAWGHRSLYALRGGSSLPASRWATRAGVLRRGGQLARGGPDSLLLFRLLPDGVVDLLVERRTPRGELAQFVVLRPHQRRAVRERPAHAAAVELARLHQLSGEVR